MVLNAMRQGAKSGISKVILFGFMVMAVGGLVLMDVGGFFRPGNVANGNVVTIGRDKLSAVEFDRMVRKILQSQNADVTAAWHLGMIDSILDAEISNNLILRAAGDTGIYVGDHTIATELSDILDSYVDDKTTRKQALQRLVAAQGMSEDEFIGAVRQEMTNNIMKSAVVLAGGVASEAEARDLYQYTFESRAVDMLVMPDTHGIEVEPPADAVLLPLYQAGQEKYAIPETRVLTLAVASEEALKSQVTITDDELKAIYESQAEGYKMPEKRSLEQTIMPDQAKAGAIAARLQKGESMKAAVKAETGSEDAYLGIAAFEKQGLAKEVADKAFTGKPGDVIGPVQTALGWHVLVLKDIAAPRTRAFDEVKDDLRKGEMQSRLAKEMFALSGQIEDGIAAGTPVAELAKELGMTVEKIGPVRADGSTPEAKEGFKSHEEDRSQILAAAFEIGEGETSAVLEFSNGSYAIVHVEQVTKKTYKPFDEVKAEIARVWVGDQLSVMNKQRAEKALARLKAGEVTLPALASELKLAVKPVKLVRAEDPPAPLNGAGKVLLFEPALGGFTMTPVKDGFAVAKVSGINIPDPSKAKKEDLDRVRTTALRATQDEILRIYLETLRKEYGVKVNRKLLEQIYSGTAQQPET